MTLEDSVRNNVYNYVWPVHEYIWCSVHYAVNDSVSSAAAEFVLSAVWDSVNFTMHTATHNTARTYIYNLIKSYDT